MQWLARGEPSVPAGDAWLTEVEAGRAAAMRFTKRRTEYRVRRYAGKCAVAAVLGLSEEPGDLARIGVLNAPTGAPYVQVDGQRIGMDVSLTDRAGWAVCLVGADLGAVGVDLEIAEPRSDGFVRDFLTPAERAVVAGMPDRAAHDAAANLIWSAKESALKVLRTGLRADTRTVEIGLSNLEGVADGGTGGGAAPALHGALAQPATEGVGAWHPLTARTVLGVLPGWWRRDGLFLLTVVTGSALAPPWGVTVSALAPPRGVTGSAPAPPPTALPGTADLATAQPIHSWIERPLAD